MAVLNGWDTRPFPLAIQELLAPGALVNARRVVEEITGYVVWGEYGRILGGYLDVFPQEQLLVLFTSQLHENPRAVLARVFDFLGVDPTFVPDNLGIAYRQSGTGRRLQWFDLIALQKAVATSHVGRTLWHTMPEPTRRRVAMHFDRMKYAVELWNRRSGNAAPAADAETETALRGHYGRDAERLTELLGATPPWSGAS